MAYQVLLAAAAQADAERIYDWVIERAPVHGAEWFDALMQSLHSLRKLPLRCPLAKEVEQAQRAIRCLHFGKRRHVYRILYEVDETSRTVWVLHIRHGAMQHVEFSSHLSKPID